MKVRCSGTVPCDTCAGAGQACLYSVSNRVGRPPGAKNKRSTIEETATGQNCWVLESPVLPQRQQSNPQARQLDHQHISRQKTPLDSTPVNLSVRVESGTTDQMESHDYAFSGPNDRMVWRGEYDYSAAVGGTWDWSSSDPESIVPSSSTGENTNRETFTSAAMQTPQVINPSVMSVDQPPPSGAAQTSPSQSDDTQGGRQYAKLPRPQPSRNCSCFEQTLKLLCTLKRAGSSEDQISDLTNSQLMVKIHKSLETWKGLVECPSCAHDEDSDIIVLALMCGRQLITRIQAEPGLYDDGPTPRLSPPMVLGGYEVKEDEKSMLLHALHSIMFKKLERVIMDLKEVLGRKKRLLQVTAKLATYSNDLTYADQMLYNIMVSLKTLQNSREIG
ncbi:hypothetical protein O1611_g7942 [Lasiodiplodia mahajangana]|uniref:Uncharacterized protein n=1 Tax=Lasiodiplodia mahajangana TaxID=1108764 RepID=A0ACC2JE42_9PEZI|nr:hypothetical protein O1611_g7942 [Lasiodiplodia mahajangana]